MKASFFLIFIAIIYGNINAQIVEHIISTTYVEAGSIFAADFDGDGDMDVLSASTGGNSIDWWGNLDGFGNFGPQQNITTNVDRCYQILAADVNGDGWMDVLSVSREDDKLAWYENTDGLGTFGPQQLITAQANVDGARFVDCGVI